MSAGSYSSGSVQTIPPNICSGCGVEFGKDVEMFTPVASDKAKQAARKLMDNPPEEKLCAACFIEHIKSLDKKVLANVMMGLAKQIRELKNKPNKYPWDHMTTTDRIYTDPNIGIVTLPTTVCPKTYPSISPPSIGPTVPWIGDDPNGGTVTY